MRRRRVAAAVVVALLGTLVGVIVLAGPAGSGGSGPGGSGSGGSGPGGADAGSSRSAAPRGSSGAAAPLPGAAAPEAAPDASAAAGGVPGQAGTGLGVGRDVVRTAELTIEVADPAAASRLVRATVVAAGGFVTEEQVEAAGGAWLVVRVPAAGLDRLVDDLAATGRIVSRSGRAEDVTEQVVDLGSRVATQQASVTRVRALLAQATSIGDIVALESELASREADLDSLQRRLAAVRDRVALSTVTIDLRRPAGSPTPSEPVGFGSGLDAGWEGLRAVGTAVAVVAGFLLPFLPVLALAAAAAVFVARRRARRSPGATPAPAAAGPTPGGVPPGAPVPAAPQEGVPVAAGTRSGPGPEGGV